MFQPMLLVNIKYIKEFFNCTQKKRKKKTRREIQGSPQEHDRFLKLTTEHTCGLHTNIQLMLDQIWGFVMPNITIL